MNLSKISRFFKRVFTCNKCARKRIRKRVSKRVSKSRKVRKIKGG